VQDVTVAHRRIGQRVGASVRTGPSVGDRERVTPHILAVCVRWSACWADPRAAPSR